MFATTQHETALNLLKEAGLPEDQLKDDLKLLSDAESRYLKDLKINVSNALNSESFTRKEAYLIALAVAANEHKPALKDSFAALARENGATLQETAEAIACTSLMNTNNVFYRFRHFVKKEFYSTTPAGIKMSVMASPVLGKEFFELLSLVISALNGCELCVTSHEEALIKQGTPPQRILDAVKLGAILKSLAVVV